jgi:hypothetical protein
MIVRTGGVLVGALSLLLLAIACAPTSPLPGNGRGRSGGGFAGERGEGGDGAAGAEGGDGAAGGEGGEGGAAGGGVAGEGLASRAKGVLVVQCARCHKQRGCGSTRGGFGGDWDYRSIVDCGYVVPGAPESSPLWQRLTSDDMPPGGQVGRDDKATVFDWIAAGAPEPPGG